MEPDDYWDVEPPRVVVTDEQAKRELVRMTYNDFKENLETVARRISIFPPEVQQMLVAIVRRYT